MKNNLYPISKEGFSYIAYAVGAFIVFYFLDIAVLEFLSFILILFFIYVFRNPERVIQNYDHDSVTSPVDGMVVSIEEVDDVEYKYIVKIESSYFDVSLLRSPMNGSIEKISLQRGARLSQYESLASKLNEKAELIFVNNKNNRIKVVHTLKQSIDAITLDVVESQKLLQGTRYGFMVNGVTAIYLPKNFRINVHVGTQILASDTLMGYFS